MAYITGTVDQELLARNEYLAAENRVVKKLKGPRGQSVILCQSKGFAAQSGTFQ